MGKSTALIYSSRSATAEDLRWRALVPLRTLLAGADYADTASAFFDLLEAAGLVLDRSLTRPGQPVYLPNRGDFMRTTSRKARGWI